MYLTNSQLLWLDRHGGRTQEDVHVDGGGLMFVLMGDPKRLAKMEKVYLPDQGVATDGTPFTSFGPSTRDDSDTK